MSAGDKRYFELDFTDTIEDGDLIALGRGESPDGTLATTAKILGEYLGAIPFDGSRPITRNIVGASGLNLGTDTLVDFIGKLFFPTTAPAPSISINNPFREVGSDNTYVLTWSVVKNTNPITGITVDSVVVTPTGNNQSGTQSGTVGSSTGVYTKTIQVTDGVSDPISASAVLTYLLKIFWSAVSAVPVNSAAVRALANSQLTNVGNTFVLNTGTTYNKFSFAIPAGKSLLSVIDEDALNFDITSFYILTTMNVNDAGGNPQSYKVYTMQDAVTYLTNHRHIITIA